MMNGMTKAFVALAATGLSWAASAAPRDPSGVWLTEDARARVRVEKCGASRENLCGYIVWLKPNTAAATTDRKNPDPSKANRPVLGHQLILGLKPNSDDHYEGQIYNADDGKSYDVEIWVASANGLKVKGCLIAFLCKTQDWTKVTDTVPNQLTAATGTTGGPTPDPEWAQKAASAAPAKRDAKPRP